MKLKCKFEYVKIDDCQIAVPVGGDENTYKGMISMTEDSKEIIELIDECDNPNELIKILLERYPEEKKDVLSRQVCDFLNVLIDKGLLDPNA